MGKGSNGRAHTREVTLGCVLTQTTKDAEGWPVRDEDSTTYTGAIETAAEFPATSRARQAPSERCDGETTTLGDESSALVG